jgi:outer membrane protein insertion porin family
VSDLTAGPFGCPQYDGNGCIPGLQNGLTGIQPELKTIPGTNFRPRMSTGIELQVIMPVVNAPLRVYWAYNPLRLNTSANTPMPFTRAMFPQAPNPGAGAGDFTYASTVSSFAPQFLLKEPTKTFRFTVSTTF